jgi:hypothetical protein
MGQGVLGTHILCCNVPLLPPPQNAPPPSRRGVDSIPILGREELSFDGMPRIMSEILLDRANPASNRLVVKELPTPKSTDVRGCP